MTTEFLIGLGIEIIVLVASLTWTIGKMGGKADILAAEIRGLGKSVDDLRDELRKESERGDQHTMRIGRLEGKVGHG